MYVLCSKGLVFHLMLIFVKGPQLLGFCISSHLEVCRHATLNGQPQQLEMTEYVLHVGAIVYNLNIYKAVDKFPLVQPNMNIFFIERHFLGDTLCLSSLCSES